MRAIGRAMLGVLVALGGAIGWAQVGRGPDLVVQEIKVAPENPKPGDLVTIAVTVANVGNEDIITSFFVCISVNLMPDAVATELGLPLNELLLGREQIRRLERNRQATVTLQWQVAELPLIRFRASVDCTFNQVQEQNEENNRLEQPLRLEEQYINQWWLDQIQARQAHTITLGSPEVVVAVLDTGVDWRHPELVENIWVNPKEIPDNNKDDDGNGFIDDIHGWDFYDNDNDSLQGTTIHFHGTSVAGIIASAADNIGLTGVAPRVKIMDVRAFDPRGRATVDSIVKALDYAVANGARIVNMSFGGFGCFELPEKVRQAVERAVDKGVILVASAGNFGEAFPNCVSYPAAYPGVIAVGATGTDGNVTSYSQGGSKLDVVAPGGDISYEKFLELAAKIENFEQFLPLLKTAILTPYPFGGYGPFFGTSAAAPHVSGVLALMLSVNPKLSAADAANILRMTATRRSPRSRYGYGVVNALRAVQQAQGGGF
jgi:subtilisin family serine protease